MSKERQSTGIIEKTLNSLMGNYLKEDQWWQVIGLIRNKGTIKSIIKEAAKLGICLPEEAEKFLTVSVNRPDQDLYRAGLILQLVGLRNTQIRERHCSQLRAHNPALEENDIFKKWADFMNLGSFNPETLAPDVVK